MIMMSPDSNFSYAICLPIFPGARRVLDRQTLAFFQETVIISVDNRPSDLNGYKQE